jgi:type II secretory pathway component PulK
MNKLRSPYSSRNDEGVALLLTLVFIVLLTALVFDFTYEMQVEATLMEKTSVNRQAMLAAKSGMATALSILNADLEDNDSEPSATGTIEVFDMLEEPWAEPADVMHFGDALANISIIDEYGKFNLNAMFYIDDDGNEQPHPFMELILATILDNNREWYDGAPLDAILDWLDVDDDTREFGAEHDYYEDLDVPYTAKNGPMDSIEELLLVPGITPEIYFGREDFEETPLFELFTVHGHPEGRININTAPEIVVDAYLANIDPLQGKLDEVMQQRDSGGFTSYAQLAQMGLVKKNPGGPPDPPPGGQPEEEALDEPVWDMFHIYSNVFRIRSDVQHFNTQLRIEAYAYRQSTRSREDLEPQLFRLIDWRVMQ